MYGLGLLAWNSIATGQPSAREIIRATEEKMHGKTTSAEITIKLIRPTWSREMQLKTWSLEKQYVMILLQAPARDRGTAFLKRGREVWNWIPAIERHIKLPPSMMSQSWMGSDFTNDDLVKEFSMLDDYEHRLTGTDTVNGRRCYVIELTPLPQAAVVWGKVKLWIDQTDMIQLKGTYYDDNGQLVNIMNGTDVALLGGKILPRVISWQPADKPGNQTVMIYRKLVFDQPISGAFFSVENMKKLQ